MARPDYSALGGSITADDTTHTGNGGNPNLKPIRSTNLDASVEWYYAPRSLCRRGLLPDLTNYVAFGTYQTTLLDIRDNAFRRTRSRRRSTARDA
jgi:iron complex outermembrane receptor protein